MDVMTAVKDKENYGKIVSWFHDQEPLTIEQMGLLIDTIEVMSEEIFEHYKELQEIFRTRMKQIRKQCQEEAGTDSFLSDTDKNRLAYAVRKACDWKVLLAEKYESLVQDLSQ